MSESESSEPQPIAELIAARLSRRSLLQGAIAAGVAAATGVRSKPAMGKDASSAAQPIGDFEEIAHTTMNGAGPDPVTHHLPAGFDCQVVAQWGDPLFTDSPKWNAEQQSGDTQSRQFGYNNDYVAFLPLPRGSNNSSHGLLVVNHEYCNAELMFPGFKEDRRGMTDDEMNAEMAAHGVSVLEIRREEVDGKMQWQTILDSPYNRRLSPLETYFELRGPAAGHARMKISADPQAQRVLGTLGNCSGGVTPWGTFLSGEENFQEYFAASDHPTEQDNYARYGIDASPRYSWHTKHRDYNLKEEPYSANRFGWVVEFDPYLPEEPAVKRTALGRMSHEGASTALTHDGRLVVYVGDDRTNEYLYKFVSRDSYSKTDRHANRDLLDNGVLYAAQFSDEEVTWLPLVFGTGPLTAKAGFLSQADVLIETRRAAQLVGATPMDRPEDVDIQPETGRVYVILTNNKVREEDQVDAANPRPGNRHGHILELHIPQAPGGFDHGAVQHGWSVLLGGGEPSPETQAYGDKVGDSYPGWYQGAQPQGWLSCPDNCTFDNAGRIWISTDGAAKAAEIADGLYVCDTDGPHKGHTRLFFSAPVGSEVCGPCFTPDASTLFLAIQHPGEGSTFEEPSTIWPAGKAGLVKGNAGPPKPAVIAISKSS